MFMQTVQLLSFSIKQDNTLLVASTRKAAISGKADTPHHYIACLDTVSYVIEEFIPCFFTFEFVPNMDMCQTMQQLSLGIEQDNAPVSAPDARWRSSDKRTIRTGWPL